MVVKDQTTNFSFVYILIYSLLFHTMFKVEGGGNTESPLAKNFSPTQNQFKTGSKMSYEAST